MAKRKRKNPVRPPNTNAPILKGMVSPRRQVPPHIEFPPYALSGEPPASVTGDIRTPEEIKAMRQAGALAAEVLLRAGEKVEPGISTDSLDAFVHETITSQGAYPSPLNYRGFPKSVCTSANEVICHGIPDSRRLEEGDILNIDVTVYYKGVHGDTSCMFLVGQVSDSAQMLVHETLVALNAGIDAVNPGARVCDIGASIERHAQSHNLAVVREFIGHGIGRDFHSQLAIPHYFDARYDTVLKEGMTFTIEPMLNLGAPGVRFWDDKWTAVTSDGSLSAQFEHTLLVTDGRPTAGLAAGPTGSSAEILTQTPAGECAHQQYFSQLIAPGR